MKKLYSKNAVTIIISLIIILFACKKTNESNPGDGSGPGTGTGTGTVQGVITDVNNSAVSNATVTGGTATAATDASGKFTLSKVQFSNNAVLLTATKDGFFEGSKNFAVTNNAVSNARIQLIPKSVSGSFMATAGGNVTITGGGSVNFGSGFVTASNGNAYSGNVSVSTTYLNPTNQNFSETVPGNLKAVSSLNQPGVLQSFGVVAVELNDASGNKLQLAQGKTATITFPIPAALLSKAPASIPLWYFDNTSGLWKQEGTAAKQGSNYVGVVNHFSFWNVGDIAGSINLTASFTDSARGTPFVNKLVTIIRLDSTSGGASATNGHTNNTGSVSGLVPVNELLILKVYGDCGTILYSKNIGPFSKDTILSAIKIYNTCPDTTQSNVDVYVGGYEYNSSGLSEAKYWKNGRGFLESFTNDFANNFANSIAVYETISINKLDTDNIYVAGWSDWNGAIVWNGGTGTFGGNSRNSGANSVTIVGMGGYAAAGYDYNGSVSVAKSWSWISGPGGGFLSLTDGTRNAMANSITVVGSDVYVAGYEYSGTGVSVAKYWKNAQPITLSDSTKANNARSIVVIGSDVYVAGYDSSNTNSGIAKYWKNGIAIPLTSGANWATANSIAVVGSDVYVAGSENNVAKYWKNGVAIPLTGGVSASSIAVVGSDVYVSGYGYNGSVTVAKYWKNGVAIPLTNGTYNANATGIVVIKR
jgi:hypothetical protein